MGRGQEPQANTKQDLPTGSGLAWEGYEGEEQEQESKTMEVNLGSDQRNRQGRGQGRWEAQVLAEAQLRERSMRWPPYHVGPHSSLSSPLQLWP